MSLSSLLLLATIIFIGMVSPGPDFVLITKNALIHPRRQALATAFGVVCGCFVHATYCILGLAWVITQSATLFSFIKYAGAAYLVYLGVRGLFHRSQELKLSFAGNGEQLSVRGAFVQGLLCNLLNPKLAVFLLSLFTQFISPAASIGEKSAVAAIFVGQALLYWPMLALVLQSSYIRDLFLGMRSLVDRLCGACLIGIGARVAVSRD